MKKTTKKKVDDRWETNPVARKIKHSNTQGKEAINNAKDFKNLDRKGYLEGDIPLIGVFLSGLLIGGAVTLIGIHVLLMQVL